MTDTLIRDAHVEHEVPATMYAARLHGYGGQDALVYEEVPVPTPGEQEVLVRVQAAGINPLDWKLREGHLKEIFPLTFPVVLGSDLAGVVAAVGSGVSALKVGDKVYGVADTTRGGAFAEYAIAKAGAVAHRPRLLSATDSASVPVVAMTAWEAVHEVGRVLPDSKVLIHGAGGMVGRFAIQFAHRLHCHIFALVHHQDVHIVRHLGASTVFDYDTAPFEEYMKDMDFVLDTVGGTVRDRSWGTLRPGGVMVSLGDMPSQEEAQQHSVRAEAMQMHPSAFLLADIAKWLDAGELVTFVGKTFPLSQAAEALEMQGQHKVEGKIVLEVV